MLESVQPLPLIFLPLQSKPISSISTLTLYGQQVRLEFVEYLRPEEKFSSVEALVEQISADISLTREF